MSEWPAPEATRYPERSDPGFGWRHRLERRLTTWPARYRHLSIRRELTRLEGGHDGPAVTIEILRKSLRLQGLAASSLSLWHAWSRGQGADDETLAGALAMIRGMAVQCTAPASRGGMIAFASTAIALSGRTVHVLTPDEACTQQLEPVLQEHLRRVGLRAAVIEPGSPVTKRRTAYHAAVIIVSARDVLQDYLYDRLRQRPRQGEITRKLGRLAGHEPLRDTRMCGLPFGIVVDANRILIDHACEPLTIAECTDPAQEQAWAETALALAGELEEGLHFTADAGQRLLLTEAGKQQLEQRATDLPGSWRNLHRRNADVSLALKALSLEPGRHYRLVERRLELPEGIPIPDGMRQILEVREGLPVTGRHVARGKLTFQRFFRRYRLLAAVCSDIRYCRDELWQVYGLPGFTLTPATEEPPPDPGRLSGSEQRIVNAASRLSTSLGCRSGIMLASRRRRNERKAAERLRRKLLSLDYQVRNITAFSGSAE